MKKFRLKYKEINAIQYKDNVVLEGIIFTSNGWKQSGHWSDRFIDDPEKPTAYIIESNSKTKIFLEIGDWVIDDGKKIFKLSDKEFQKKYEKI